MSRNGIPVTLTLRVETATSNSNSNTPTPPNQTLFQTFEWHTPGPHYPRLTASLPLLADLGITSIWLPPGCKANAPQGNGYDCYDLWDLGEFDQKWTRKTKWGSREELDTLIHASQEAGIKVIWDAVLNHKTAGDSTEECWAVEVDGSDHTIETSRPKKIEPWIHYNFPGRGDTYSSLKWHWQHFNGTDWDQRAQRHAIYKIVDPPETAPRPGAPPAKTRRKGWAEDVDDEHGNADYLMFSNIDYTNEEARQDVLRWGEWMVRDIGVDGFRLDAVQHYSWNFTREWIERVKRARPDAFVVGEFWVYDVAKLVRWIGRVGEDVYAYDSPLLASFSRASLGKGRFDVDLRKIYRNTLVAAKPNNAIVSTSCQNPRGDHMLTILSIDYGHEPRYTARPEFSNSRHLVLQASSLRPDTAAEGRLSLRLLRRPVRHSRPSCRAACLRWQTLSTGLEQETIRVWRADGLLR